MCFITVGARDVKLEPSRETYYVGEVINCTALGQPEPDFKWIAVHPIGNPPAHCIFISAQ